MSIDRSRSIALVAGVLTLLTVSGAAFGVSGAIPNIDDAGQAATATFKPDHVLVRIDGATGRQAAATAALDAQANVVEVKWTSALVPGLRCVRVAPGGMDAALAAYRADPRVRYAEPDAVRHTFAQSTPFGITMVQAPLEWPQSRGAGVLVADLDTGVDLAHPDLPVPVLTQSFVTGVSSVADGHGHGTHTAGTISALDNTQGVVGVAPSVSMLIGKVLDDTGNGDDAWVAAGIDWAVANNARVISMSLGGPIDTQALRDSCAAALAAGTLVVAAAGNDNSATPSYPGAYPSVLSVAAIDSAMARASFSNFGPTISLSAPGVNVQSTYIGSIATWSSTPHSALPLTGSAGGSVAGNAVYCGLGDSAAAFPASVAGQIAHIRRGTNTFQNKVQNAINAGAVGVIISNNAAGLFSGTLNQTFNVPVIGISQADGNDLQTKTGTAATACTACDHTYTNLSGTSMACPHVSGVAALLFGAAPSATPAQVRTAMEQTALDLGAAGRDDQFGYGLVRANLAATYLLSHLCRADFNNSGAVSVQDIFDFLASYFSNNIKADFNGSGTVTVQDIFDFLAAWFKPC